MFPYISYIIYNIYIYFMNRIDYILCKADLNLIQRLTYKWAVQPIQTYISECHQIYIK